MAYQYSGITEQHKASIHRRVDAEALRESKRWRGAMYLLGYAVECSLKARLMERFGSRNLQALEEVLSKRLQKSLNLKTHSLDVLFEFTSSEHRLGDVRTAFQICRRWRVEWRYNPRAGTESECQEFFDACGSFLQFVTSSV